GGCSPADGGGDDSGDGSAPLPSDCAQSFATNLNLTTDWVRYDIPLTQLVSNPSRAPVVRDQIYSFLFGVPANTTFDLWIDDISWIPAEPAP
ncbi:MAG TPA: hypothetical protein VGL13_18030, partial [Polyangiaceae bacterium]